MSPDFSFLHIRISSNSQYITERSVYGQVVLSGCGNSCQHMQAHKANSHAKKGWECFTDTVISHLSSRRKGLVFLLWGKHAQARKKAIWQNGHTVLECAHPSGLSAHRGFFGCKHFSQANAALKKNGVPEIDWKIPS